MEGYSTLVASLFTRFRGGMNFDLLKEMPVGHQFLAYMWVCVYQLLISSLVLSMLRPGSSHLTEPL